MKRARKKKLEAPKPSPEIDSISASAGNDERLVIAATAAPLALAAPPALPDALDEELNAALENEYVASECAKQLAKDERSAIASVTQLWGLRGARCTRGLWLHCQSWGYTA